MLAGKPCILHFHFQQIKTHFSDRPSSDPFRATQIGLSTETATKTIDWHEKGAARLHAPTSPMSAVALASAVCVSSQNMSRQSGIFGLRMANSQNAWNMYMCVCVLGGGVRYLLRFYGLVGLLILMHVCMHGAFARACVCVCVCVCVCATNLPSSDLGVHGGLRPSELLQHDNEPAVLVHCRYCNQCKQHVYFHDRYRR